MDRGPVDGGAGLAPVPPPPVVHATVRAVVQRHALRDRLEALPALATAVAHHAAADLQLKVAADVEQAGVGVAELLHDTRRSKEALSSLETRLARMRVILHPAASSTATAVAAIAAAATAPPGALALHAASGGAAGAAAASRVLPTSPAVKMHLAAAGALVAHGHTAAAGGASFAPSDAVVAGTSKPTAAAAIARDIELALAGPATTVICDGCGQAVLASLLAQHIGDCAPAQATLAGTAWLRKARRRRQRRRSPAAGHEHLSGSILTAGTAATATDSEGSMSDGGSEGGDAGGAALTGASNDADGGGVVDVSAVVRRAAAGRTLTAGAATTASAGGSVESLLTVQGGRSGRVAAAASRGQSLAGGWATELGFSHGSSLLASNDGADEPDGGDSTDSDDVGHHGGGSGGEEGVADASAAAPASATAALVGMRAAFAASPLGERPSSRSLASRGGGAGPSRTVSPQPSLLGTRIAAVARSATTSAAAPPEPPADGRASASPSPTRRERYERRRQRASAPLLTCPTCHRRYPQHRFNRHAIDCTKKFSVAVAVSRLGRGVVHAVAPHPPTNLRVLAVGPTSISLTWSPPLFDGGSFVCEYQVQYCRRHVVNPSRLNPVHEDVLQPLASTLTAVELRRAADPDTDTAAGRRRNKAALAAMALGEHPPGRHGAAADASGSALASLSPRTRAVVERRYRRASLVLGGDSDGDGGTARLPLAEHPARAPLMDTPSAQPSIAYEPSFLTSEARTEESAAIGAGAGVTAPAVPLGGHSGSPPRAAVVPATLAPRSIALTGLDANTSYTGIRVRAVNFAGVSAWSGAIDLATTKPPAPPSAPRNVAVAAVTTDTITLAWDPPLATGGVPLHCYTVRFREHLRHFGAAVLSRDINATSAADRSIVLPADTVSHTFTGLRAATLYSTFVILATNTWNLVSEPSAPAVAATTHSLSREQEILQELEQLYHSGDLEDVRTLGGDGGGATDAPGSHEAEVDVYYHRVFQRMKRSRYIELLQAELAAVRAARTSAHALAPVAPTPTPPPPVEDHATAAAGAPSPGRDRRTRQPPRRKKTLASLLQAAKAEGGGGEAAGAGAAGDGSGDNHAAPGSRELPGPHKMSLGPGAAPADADDDGVVDTVEEWLDEEEALGGGRDGSGGSPSRSTSGVGGFAPPTSPPASPTRRGGPRPAGAAVQRLPSIREEKDEELARGRPTSAGIPWAGDAPTAAPDRSLSPGMPGASPVPTPAPDLRHALPGTVSTPASAATSPHSGAEEFGGSLASAAQAMAGARASAAPSRGTIVTTPGAAAAISLVGALFGATRTTRESRAPDSTASAGTALALTVPSPMAGWDPEFVGFDAAPHVRRAHFHHKLQLLSSRVAEFEADLLRLQGHLAKLTNLLSEADKRRRVLAAEAEIARSVSTGNLDSHIIHGQKQVFPIEELRTMLATESAQLAATVVALRGIIVDTEAEIAKVQSALEKQREALAERKAAYNSFELEVNKRSRIVGALKRATADFLPRCWRAWRQFVGQRRRIKRMYVRSLLRWMHRRVGLAWSAWAAFARLGRAQDAVLTSHMAATAAAVPAAGIGSYMLGEAEVLRQRLMADATELTSWLSAMQGEVAAAEAHLEDRKLVTYMAGSADAAAPMHLYGPAMAATAPLPRAVIGSLHDRELDAALRDALVVHARRHPAGGAHAPTATTMLAAVVAGADIGRLRAAHGATATSQRDALAKHATELVQRGTAYHGAGHLVEAYRELRQAELIFGYFQDTPGLLSVTRMYAFMLEAAGQAQIGCIMWGRAMQMAATLAHDAAAGEAHEGYARCTATLGDTADHVHYLQLAEAIYERRADRPALARVCTALVEPLHRLGRSPEAQEYERRARDLSTKFEQMVGAGAAVLEELRARLHDATVLACREVTLEVCGVVVPLLRSQRELLVREAKEVRVIARTLAAAAEKAAARLVELRAALAEVEGIAEDEPVESGVCNGGAPKRYLAGLLRLELGLEIARMTSVATSSANQLRLCDVRLDNLRVGIADIDAHLGVEASPLVVMHHRKHELKYAALNPRNVAINDVVGVATRGVNRLVTALDRTLLVFSTVDGRCTQTMCSTAEGRAAGPKPAAASASSLALDLLGITADAGAGAGAGAGASSTALVVSSSTRSTASAGIGHVKNITAVCCMDARTYTGAGDGSICAWIIAEAPRFDGRAPSASALEWELADSATIEAALTDDPLKAAAGKAAQSGLVFCIPDAHAAAVVSLAAASAYFVSGGADNGIRVWSYGGELLRRLRAHEASVTALSASESHFATGSADRCVLLWGVETRPVPASPVPAVVNVNQTARLEAHEYGVSCVSCTGLDVVSGDTHGVVVVWNAVTATPLRKYAVHKPGRPVVCLQFDATKIISFGGDRVLTVTDLMTGKPTQQTPQPHGDARLIALQFDTNMLVTVGADRTMRLWPWKNGRFSNEPALVADRPREHIVQKEEQLSDVARFYGVELEDLMRWNVLRDAHRTYPGMRLALHGTAAPAVPHADRRASAVDVRATVAARAGGDGDGEEPAAGGGSGEAAAPRTALATVAPPPLPTAGRDAAGHVAGVPALLPHGADAPHPRAIFAKLHGSAAGARSAGGSMAAPASRLHALAGMRARPLAAGPSLASRLASSHPARTGMALALTLRAGRGAESGSGTGIGGGDGVGAADLEDDSLHM